MKIVQHIVMSIVITVSAGAFAADNAHNRFHYTENLPIEPWLLQDLYSISPAKKPNESHMIPVCSPDLITTFASHKALHDKNIRSLIMAYCEDDAWEPFKFYCVHQQLDQQSAITHVQFSDNPPEITVQFSTQQNRYGWNGSYRYDKTDFSASHRLLFKTIDNKHCIFDEAGYPHRQFRHNPKDLSPATTVHAYSPQRLYYAQANNNAIIVLYRNKHKLLAKALTHKNHNHAIATFEVDSSIVNRDEQYCAQPAKSLCVIQ